jgi:hypothetical protein
MNSVEAGYFAKACVDPAMARPINFGMQTAKQDRKIKTCQVRQKNNFISG